MALCFLLDENICNQDVREFLEGLGHKVYLSTERLLPGASDRDVCKVAESLGAIVVTQNVKDFRNILCRRQDRTLFRYRKAGYLGVPMLDFDVLASRLNRLLCVVEYEQKAVEQEPDKRVLAELEAHRIILVR